MALQINAPDAQKKPVCPGYFCETRRFRPYPTIKLGDTIGISVVNLCLNYQLGKWGEGQELQFCVCVSIIVCFVER